MNEKRRVRVLVVDDHPVVRQGICALLETEPDIEVVGEASDGRRAIEQVEALDPDVVLMDLVMPKGSGIEAIEEITMRGEGTRVLVLTSFSGDELLFPAIRAGAIGYLLKDTAPHELVRAIQDAAVGHSALDPAISKRLLRELTRESIGPDSAPALTPREIEVLRLVAHGHSNEQIAQGLQLSEATVRTHVSHVLGKLGLSNRTQAALYALKNGLASLTEISDQRTADQGLSRSIT